MARCGIAHGNRSKSMAVITKQRMRRFVRVYAGIIIRMGFLLIVGVILLYYVGAKENRSVYEEAGSMRPEPNDAVLGDPKAPITLIVYADYQCQFCGIFYKEVLRELEPEFITTGKVNIMHRDFIVFGSKSLDAANAAACAKEQGQFWQYHNLLFSKQERSGLDPFSRENLKAFGRELSFDQKRFAECVDSGRYDSQISDSTKKAQALGVRMIPSFFINGLGPISGSLRSPQFKNLLDNALKDK